MGSNPFLGTSNKWTCSSVVEQLTVNQLVVGSIPTKSSYFKNNNYMFIKIGYFKKKYTNDPILLDDIRNKLTFTNLNINKFNYFSELFEIKNGEDIFKFSTISTGEGFYYYINEREYNKLNNFIYDNQ